MNCHLADSRGCEVWRRSYCGEARILQGPNSVAQGQPSTCAIVLSIEDQYEPVILPFSWDSNFRHWVRALASHTGLNVDMMDRG